MACKALLSGEIFASSSGFTAGAPPWTTARTHVPRSTRVGLLGANGETLESGLLSEMPGGFFRQPNMYEFIRWYTFRELDNVIPESPREFFQSGDLPSEVF